MDVLAAQAAWEESLIEEPFSVMRKSQHVGSANGVEFASTNGGINEKSVLCFALIGTCSGLWFY